MSIIWNAKLKSINGIEQIHFFVKDSEKTIAKISGAICLDDDEVIEGDIVDYVKGKLGEQMVLEYETDVLNMDDELPVVPHLQE